jgi:ligand-binding sensor domain-containing protein
VEKLNIITQNKGLSNNTALSLYEDVDKTWVGLDNGINCINLQSPIQNFVDDTEFWGLFTPQNYNGNLYVGTNQGLFYKKYQTSDEFKFISGTKGQVWSLFEQEGTLCAVTSGTFVVKTPLQKIYFRLQERGNLRPFPIKEDLLLQGLLWTFCFQNK